MNRTDRNDRQDQPLGLIDRLCNRALDAEAQGKHELAARLWSKAHQAAARSDNPAVQGLSIEALRTAVRELQAPEPTGTVDGAADLARAVLTRLDASPRGVRAHAGGRGGADRAGGAGGAGRRRWRLGLSPIAASFLLGALVTGGLFAASRWGGGATHPAPLAREVPAQAAPDPTRVASDIAAAPTPARDVLSVTGSPPGPGVNRPRRARVDFSMDAQRRYDVASAPAGIAERGESWLAGSGSLGGGLPAGMGVLVPAGGVDGAGAIPLASAQGGTSAYLLLRPSPAGLWLPVLVSDEALLAGQAPGGLLRWNVLNARPTNAGEAGEAGEARPR